MTKPMPLVACWFDSGIGEDGAHNSIKQRFEQISPRITRWEFGDNSDLIIEKIQQNPTIRFIFITSGAWAHQKIPLISQEPNLHSFYIYCGRKTKYEDLMNSEPKLKGIFDDDDLLYEKLSQDLRSDFP